MSNVFYNSYTKQYYTVPNSFYYPGIERYAALNNPTLWNQQQKNGLVKILGGPNSSSSQNNQFNTASISTAYTPNQFTANQLGALQSGSLGAGGNTIPAWMHNAFANKMGRMGAPTTEPFPYQITGSSFRGMPAGKAAPTGGQ